MVSLEQILIYVSLLLILATVASKVSSSVGIPSLVLFIIIGALAGSEGLGKIEFWDPPLAQSIGTIALAFILFSGGLDTSWQSIKPVLLHGLALSTIGVAITAVAVALFASLVLDLTLLEGLLLGSVVSSTDAAAVFAVLRSKGIRLKGHLRPLLELESGSNDPMAVFLTIGFTGLLVDANQSSSALVPLFLQQMVVGGLVGYCAGRVLPVVLNRFRLDYEGLYPVFTTAAVVLTYGGTASLGGNGFLAVYLCGIIAGRGQFIHKGSLMRFHDAVAWLVQIAMFLTLGLLVFPSELVPVIGSGTLVAIFLILVARPISVLICLAPSRSMHFREKLLISWVGLRGAVPIILATFPLVAEVQKAHQMFNLVFFIVVTSVVLQGPLIPFFARFLGVQSTDRESPLYPIGLVAGSGDKRMVEFDVGKSSPVVGKSIVQLALPPKVLVVLLHRDDTFLVPGGGTVVEAGDRLLVLAHQDSLPKIRSILGSHGRSHRE
jgi:potassium/hydrogen antiporter